jgi:hypothetical protein
MLSFDICTNLSVGWTLLVCCSQLSDFSSALTTKSLWRISRIVHTSLTSGRKTKISWLFLYLANLRHAYKKKNIPKPNFAPLYMKKLSKTYCLNFHLTALTQIHCTVAEPELFIPWWSLSRIKMSTFFNLELKKPHKRNTGKIRYRIIFQGWSHTKILRLLNTGYWIKIVPV